MTAKQHATTGAGPVSLPRAPDAGASPNDKPAATRPCPVPTDATRPYWEGAARVSVTFEAVDESLALPQFRLVEG